MRERKYAYELFPKVLKHTKSTHKYTEHLLKNRHSTAKQITFFSMLSSGEQIFRFFELKPQKFDTVSVHQPN